MKILAADTSTSINTVAVCAEGNLLAETVVDCGRAHSERLIETVHWVLREAGVTLQQIDLLAISAGPGSFTGVRVGVATWKGLALGAGLPLMAVPTLDAMTRLGWFRDTLVCPLLDARMHEVFGAIYRFRGGQREKLIEDVVCPVEQILERVDAGAVFLGPGAEAYRNRITAQRPGAVFAPAWCGVPRAAAVAAEAQDLVARGASADAAKVEPVYLRASQAEMNRAKRKASAHG